MSTRRSITVGPRGRPHTDTVRLAISGTTIVITDRDTAGTVIAIMAETGTGMVTVTDTCRGGNGAVRSGTDRPCKAASAPDPASGGAHRTRRLAAVALIAAISLTPLPGRTHEAVGPEHFHVYQRTGYGSYRQGHYVNGPQGSIIIWSARPVAGYSQPPRVRFAHPSPVTRAPGRPVPWPGPVREPGRRYGERPGGHQ
jgi:hypothetical protein